MRFALFMLGMIVLAIIPLSFDNLSARLGLGAQNEAAKNMTAVIANSTVIGMSNATAAGNTTRSIGMSNATAAGNTTSSNNVTAAAGNNGHIYRGGAAAGSGGE